MGARGWNAVLDWRTKDWNQFDVAAEGGTLGDQANSMLVHVKRTCGGAERQSSFDPCGLLSCRSGWMSAGCEE